MRSDAIFEREQRTLAKSSGRREMGFAIVRHLVTQQNISALDYWSDGVTCWCEDRLFARTLQ